MHHGSALMAAWRDKLTTLWFPSAMQIVLTNPLQFTPGVGTKINKDSMRLSWLDSDCGIVKNGKTPTVKSNCHIMLMKYGKTPLNYKNGPMRRYTKRLMTQPAKK